MHPRSYFVIFFFIFSMACGNTSRLDGPDDSVLVEAEAFEVQVDLAPEAAPDLTVFDDGVEADDCSTCPSNGFRVSTVEHVNSLSRWQLVRPLATWPDGRFAVLWLEAPSDPNAPGAIQARFVVRFFGSNGVPLAPPVPVVEEDQPFHVFDGGLLELPNGEALVTWVEDHVQAGWVLRARRVSYLGTIEDAVTISTGGPRDRYFLPTSMPTGGYLALWQREPAPNQSGTTSILLGRFDSRVQPTSQPVSIGTSEPPAVASPFLAHLQDDLYLVSWNARATWTMANPTDDSVLAVVNSSGDLQREMAPFGGRAGATAAARLASGDIAVAWEGLSLEAPAGQSAPFVATFGPALQPLVAPFKPSRTDPELGGFLVRLAAMADGGFVVAWADAHVQVQRFASDGTEPAPPIHPYWEAPGGNPSVGTFADGGFIAVWEFFIQSDPPQRTDVLGIRFNADGSIKSP